jgi:reticulon-4-interacting protein 1, mitochondrial
MRAWSYYKAGNPLTILSLFADYPTPKLTLPTDVLVRISYTALNPGPSIMMTLWPKLFRAAPCIPELDFSGTIVAAGSAVRPELASGTEVFGSVHVMSEHKSGYGCLAEYVLCDSDRVVIRPKGMEMAEASGLGVAGCSALQLVEKAALKGGEKVMVVGGSGGIGTFVVQMVRRKIGSSGRIVVVCSGRNAELVKSLGADEVCKNTVESIGDGDGADESRSSIIPNTILSTSTS